MVCRILANIVVCSRFVNIAVGVIMVLGGISQFFPLSMSALIVGIYVILFGVGKLGPTTASIITIMAGYRMLTTRLVIGGLEFLPTIPDYVYRYASFLFSFLGRGVCKFSQKKGDMTMRY